MGLAEIAETADFIEWVFNKYPLVEETIDAEILAAVYWYGKEFEKEKDTGL